MNKAQRILNKLGEALDTELRQWQKEIEKIDGSTRGWNFGVYQMEGMGFGGSPSGWWLKKEYNKTHDRQDYHLSLIVSTGTGMRGSVESPPFSIPPQHISTQGLKKIMTSIAKRPEIKKALAKLADYASGLAAHVKSKGNPYILD